MSQPTHRSDKILVVDDDARIRDLLRRYLTQEGFEVLQAEDGKSLTRILLRETVDLIVLDLMMPGEDGLSICRRLRAANDRTPIIMLTAKGEDVDRIVGLEVGADDYLGKPFNPRELLARIHAVLRRRPVTEAPGSPSSENEVVGFGPFVFDIGARTLRRDNDDLPLTTGEFAMLKALVRHPRGYASLWRWTPPRPGTSRRCGAWAMSLCRMVRVDHLGQKTRGPARHHLADGPGAAQPRSQGTQALGCESVLAHFFLARAAACGQHSGVAADAARA